MESRPGRPRGPYAKTAARRAAIIRAARDSFAERGFTGASLRDIAERAGTTHAGLLHHFATKDQLLTEVLAARDAEEMTRGLAEVAGPAELAGYLGELLRQHEKTPELMRLWVELAVAASRPGHPAHDYFTGRYDRLRTRAVGDLNALAAQGKLHEGVDPDSAAALFYAVLNGLQILWLLNPELDIVTPLERFLALVFRMDDTDE